MSRSVCSFRLLVLSEKEAMKVGSRNEMSEKLIFHSFNELKDCINEIKISRVPFSLWLFHLACSGNGELSQGE